MGRVEEMPAAAGGARGGRLLERRLVRIYSPGTAVEGLLAVSGAGGDDVNVYRGHICYHLCGHGFVGRCLHACCVAASARTCSICWARSSRGVCLLLAVVSGDLHVPAACCCSTTWTTEHNPSCALWSCQLKAAATPQTNRSLSSSSARLDTACGERQSVPQQ